jgi:pimeloyl-ACP methyl ester carboxylesterase
VDWETGGAPLDPAWLELAAAGTRFPTRLVVPRRPSRRQLRELDVPTLVVLAGRSRAHDMRRVAARASRLPHVTVTELPDVSHHGMPSVHADRLNRELLAFLD